MRGQVAIAAAAIMLAVTLILLVALPKRTFGPEVATETDAVITREIQHLLRNAVEEAVFNTAMSADRLALEAADSGTNVDDIKKVLNNTFLENLKFAIVDKAATYLALRGIYCKIRNALGEVGESTGAIYIKSIYVELQCTDSRTGLTKIAFINSKADVSVAGPKPVGFTKGVKITVKLYRDQQPIYLILYGSTLYVKRGGDGKPYVFSLLGSYSPKDAVWFFNVTEHHDIKLALPPEFAQAGSDVKWSIVVAAASLGEGAGTVVVIRGSQ